MDIKKIALKTIEKHALFSRGDRVLIGLSGGADSVSLFHILLCLADKLGIEIAAAHINHSLRDTAQRDMEFCKKLCKSKGVDFFCTTIDVKNGAKLAKKSEELYARQARYDFFESLGFTKIATAHNKNDAAETILHNFMRGSSIRGLSGIPYKRGNIVRPLLDIKKEEILEFCHENGYEYMTDETNFEPIYTRNKIRLDLIPEIEEKFNPAFVDVVAKNAQLFLEDSEYLDALAEKEYKGEIKVSDFKKLENPIKRRIIEIHIKASSGSTQNLSSAYIEDILELLQRAQTGKRIDLPNGFCARIEYGKLIIEKKREKTAFSYRIEPEKMLNVPEIHKNILIKKCEKGDIYLDDTENLLVRSRCAGDIFYPKGMIGKKKLSDFFTDKKIPNAKRDEIPILTKDGEIVSVIGMRNDRRFKGATAYKIEILEAENAK